MIAQLTSDHTDRELAVVIYGALTQNPDAVEELRRRGATLGDAWSVIRRGRR